MIIDMSDASAFPVTDPDGGVAECGMTLRDYFAVRAGEEDIARYMEGPMAERVVFDRRSGRDRIVNRPMRYSREQARYRFAEAMLKAREEG